MKPKVRFMLVGAFVLSTSAAIVATIVWLSSARGQTDYETYVSYFTESVAGLSVNANVRYNGVPVGKVTDIALDTDDPGRVRVEMDIAEGTPVKTDTVATLTTSGITGVAQIGLSGGTAESARLQASAGEPYPVIQTEASLFVRLDESITTLVDELTGAAASLTNVAERVELLLDDENSEAIGQILANVEEFTGELEGIAQDVSRMTENVAGATEDLPRIIDATEETLLAFQASAESLEGAGASVSLAADDMAASVASVGDNANQILSDLTPLTRGVPARLVYLVDELQLLASSLRRVSQDIEQNPESILFGRRGVVRGPGE
jgi:phospholipid/cholesterol/gamma-HCH transport system substrate-binding protein